MSFHIKILYFLLFAEEEMENLKTEAIQIFDSDDEIPVLIKKEVDETPLLESPKISDCNEKNFIHVSSLCFLSSLSNHFRKFHYAKLSIKLNWKK